MSIKQAIISITACQVRIEMWRQCSIEDTCMASQVNEHIQTHLGRDAVHLTNKNFISQHITAASCALVVCRASTAAEMRVKRTQQACRLGFGVLAVHMQQCMNEHTGVHSVKQAYVNVHIE